MLPLPSPHLPAGPRAPSRLGVPGLGWQLCQMGWSQLAPGGDQPGYFWLPRTASKSQRDATFSSISPSWRPPVPRATSSLSQRCPSSPEKSFLQLRNAPATFSLFPNPRASSSILWVPWEELWVPAPACCPPKPHRVWVTTWCPQNRTDKNSSCPLPRSRAANSGAAESWAARAEPAVGGFIIFWCHESG